MSDAEAFYLPVRPGVFRSTEHTIGPWTASDQHAGPPSALLVRAMEQLLPPTGGQLSRVTVDILGAIPVADVEVTAEVVRGGRSVQLVTAELRAVNGTSHGGTAGDNSPGAGTNGNGDRVLARASGWWHRAEQTSSLATPTPPPPPRPPAGPASTGPTPTGPNAGEPNADEPGKGPVALWTTGYLAAMEWRWVEGFFLRRGPATVWTRMRYPLVPGEPPSPTQRLLVTVDSASGASSELDMTTWLFVNTELSVHLLRPPDGEWIGMAARTRIGPSGTGLATATIFDDSGDVGTSAQALLVRPR